MFRRHKSNSLSLMIVFNLTPKKTQFQLQRLPNQVFTFVFTDRQLTFKVIIDISLVFQAPPTPNIDFDKPTTSKEIEPVNQVGSESAVTLTATGRVLSEDEFVRVLGIDLTSTPWIDPKRTKKIKIGDNVHWRTVSGESVPAGGCYRLTSRPKNNHKCLDVTPGIKQILLFKIREMHLRGELMVVGYS